MLKGTPQCWAVQVAYAPSSRSKRILHYASPAQSDEQRMCSSVLSVMHSATQLSGLLLIGELCAFPKVTEVNHFCIVPKPLMC